MVQELSEAASTLLLEVAQDPGGLIVRLATLEWMSVHLHVDCYEVWDAERSALFGEIGGRGESTQIM
jgi:hypothetical protein